MTASSMMTSRRPFDASHSGPPMMPMSPAPACLPVYRMRDGDIRVASREIVLNGQRRQIEPKAFDVLVYLIGHRGRVVTKDELLTEVWRRLAVSDSVLARTVMKARAALADVNPDAPLIRTVHRVGYQFVGEIADITTSTAVAPAAAEMAPRADCRVAILPIDNQLDHVEHGWIGHSMMVQLAAALAASAGIDVAPLRATQTALDSAYGDDRVHAQQVLRTLGVDRVVHVRLTAVDSSCEAHVHLYGDGIKLALMPIRGANVEALLPRLTQAVQGALPRGNAGGWTDADPLYAELHVRARHAMAQRNWWTAIALLRSLAELQPDSLAVDRDLMSALAAARDEAPPEIGAAAAPVARRLDGARSPADQAPVAGGAIQRQAPVGAGLVERSTVLAELGWLDESARNGHVALQLAVTQHDWQRVAAVAEELAFTLGTLRRRTKLHELINVLDRCAAERPGSVAGALVAARIGLCLARGDVLGCVTGYAEYMAHSERHEQSLASRSAWPGAALAYVDAGLPDEALRRVRLDLKRWAALPEVGAPGCAQLVFGCVAHLEGRRADALRHVLRAAEEAPVGPWRALACIDASWLCCEDGRIDDAARLLLRAGRWAEELPAGLLASGRLMHARGDTAQARAAQQRYLDAMGEAVVPACFARLDEVYASCAPLADSPRLPSRT